MRRPLLALLAISTVLAAVAGVLAAGPLGAEQIRVTAERSLGSALGARVRVLTARLDLLGGPSFEALGLSAFGEDGQPSLRVSRVEARIDPVSLLLGQVRLSRVTLERPELRIRRNAEGQLTLGALATLLLGENELSLSGEEGALGLLQRAARVARSILQAPLPLLRATLVPQQVGLAGGRVVLIDERSGAHLELRDLEGKLERSRRRPGATLMASGRLVDEAGECGWLTLVGVREASGPPRLELEARHLDLRALSAYEEGLHPELRLQGVARGTARLEIVSAERQNLEVDVLVGGLRLRMPRGGGRPPLEIDGHTAVARANLEITPARLHLQSADLDLDGHRLTAEGTVERPLHAEARARLTVRVDDLDLSDIDELAEMLPEALDLSGPLAIVEAGRMDQLEITGTASLAEWGRALDPESHELPLDLAGSAQLRGVAVRMGDDDEEPLEVISGRVSLARGKLTLDDVTTSPDAPRVDLQVLGLERLLAHGVRDTRPPPEIPGLGALLRIVLQALEDDPDEPEDTEPEARAFTRLDLHVESLSHPVVGFPLRDVRLELLSGGEGGEFALTSHGSWGGLPATATGLYTQHELTLHVEVGAPEEKPGDALEPAAPSAETPAAASPSEAASVAAMQPEETPAVGDFLGADLRIENAHVRGLSLPLVTARLEGMGTHLHLRRVHAALAHSEAGAPDAGEILVEASFDLAEADAVHLRAGVELVGTALPALIPGFGLAPGDVEGMLEAGATFEGRLVPDEPLLPPLYGRMVFEARDGALVRRPPMSQAMADTGGDLAEIADGPLRFDNLGGELELGAGQLFTQALVLENERVRVVASGAVRVGAEPHDLELVVALFPRNTVDAIVGRVPLIGAILQGPDGQIIGRYLEVTGPWDAPRVAKIETGMLGGLPGFVMNGLRAIGSVLARLNPLPDSETISEDS